MKLISWNVNGIRAAYNKGFNDFFDKENTEKIKENYIKNKWIMDKYK